jgi:hypothetical protein
MPLFHLFALSNARVSTLMIVLSDVRVKESENRRLVRFWTRTHRWCPFSWSICDQICLVIRCIGSNVMLAYTNYGKTISAKRNSGRKSTLAEIYRLPLRSIVWKITVLQQRWPDRCESTLLIFRITQSMAPELSIEGSCQKLLGSSIFSYLHQYYLHFACMSSRTIHFFKKVICYTKILFIT